MQTTRERGEERGNHGPLSLTQGEAAVCLAPQPGHVAAALITRRDCCLCVCVFVSFFIVTGGPLATVFLAMLYNRGVCCE